MRIFYAMSTVYELILCITALVWFPDDGLRRIETCRNIQCDIIIQISKELCSTFCWLRVANLWKQELKVSFCSRVQGHLMPSLLCVCQCSLHLVPPDITFKIASVVLRRVYSIHCFAPCDDFLYDETWTRESLKLSLYGANLNVSPYF